MDPSSQAENPRPPAVPGRPLPPPPQPAAPRTAGEDIFDLGLTAPRPVAPAARESEPFADLWAPPTATAPPPAPAAAVAPAPAAASLAAPPVAVLEEEEPEPEHVLFPGMASRESRQRYLAGLASEGLFHLDLPPQIPEIQEIPEIPAPVAAAPAAPAVEAPPQALEAPPVPAPAAAPEPEPAAVPEPEPVATATLGELYLRQGYPAEAERIFRDVLRREPESAAALEGIAKLSQPATAGAAGKSEARHLEARDLLAGYQPAGGPGPAEGRARKSFLLSRYLERIRQGGRRDVS